MITSEAVSAFLIGAISLALELIPGLSALWGSVSTKWKPLAFLALCAVVAFGFPQLACYGITLGADATCPAGDVAGYVNNAILVTVAAWITVSAAFGFVQDPLGKRVKAKLSVQKYLKEVEEEARG